MSSKRKRTEEEEDPEREKPAKATMSLKLAPLFASSSSPSTSFRFLPLPFPTLLHATHLSPLPSSKLACYDLDGTIIRPKGSNTFPSNDKDWKFWHTSVVEKLKKVAEAGFTIVIFTNQAWPGKDPKRIKDFKTKMPVVARELGVPFHLLAARTKDQYKKPETGMMDFFLANLNDGLEIDIKESFFVGDAAGRKGDFAATDKEFAKNIKLKFLTPEEHFIPVS